MLKLNKPLPELEKTLSAIVHLQIREVSKKQVKYRTKFNDKPKALFPDEITNLFFIAERTLNFLITGSQKKFVMLFQIKQTNAAKLWFKGK